ncbi:MAG: PIN domain-containing protein [Bifidobacteriaceae bacterium]|jgi:predicted nucleic acid-binding protein|nr:PIN domain-containing protein [Bifidobacteriaceae bacterium]
MTSRPVGVDTSVAVALLTQGHPHHARVREWARGKTLYLSGHAAAETYSVLTRLHGGMSVCPEDARRLIDESFAGVLTLPEPVAASIHRVLCGWGIAGGGVYDALVALAAMENNAVLATRDARARATYEVVGVDLEPTTTTGQAFRRE